MITVLSVHQKQAIATRYAAAGTKVRTFAVTRNTLTRYARGLSVHHVATRDFGADVTVKWEGNGTYVVIRDYGYGVTGIVARISPVKY